LYPARPARSRAADCLLRPAGPPAPASD